MNDISLVREYVQACVAGNPGFSDCGPVWQLGAIGALLALAVGALLVLLVSRLRGGHGRRPSETAGSGQPFVGPAPVDQRA